MERLLWGWLGGIVLLLLWPCLPHPAVALLSAIPALLLLLYCRRVTAEQALLVTMVLLLLGFSSGLAWSLVVARARLAAMLPVACEQQLLTVAGEIVALPVPVPDLDQPFQGRINFSLAGAKATAYATSRVPTQAYRVHFRPDPQAEDCVPAGSLWQLSWRTQTLLQPGQRWQLQTRLKRPHGYANPGGFDAERWWHQNGITATGSVRTGQLLVDGEPDPDRKRWAGVRWDDLRWQIRQRLLAAFPEPSAGTVLALLTGDRVAIAPQVWERYGRTGTTHLVAISGLHIALVAWLGQSLMRRLWLCWPRAALSQPASRVAGLAGWLLAAAYALLAGMQLPAQRALLMLAVITLMRWLPGEFSRRQMLLAALSLVLLHDPLAVHAAGLWLSFVAVAVLMTGSLPVREESGVRALLRVQWWASWGLMPLSLALFARISWIGLPVNLFAIPYITLLVVPLALFGLLVWPLHDGAGLLLWAAAVTCMGWLDAVLAWAAARPWAASEFSLPGWSVFYVSLLALALLLPRGLPGRHVLWLSGLMVLWPHAPLKPGQMRVTVLDVGQGQSVHVATAQHQLLFDTGPGSSLSANAGQRIILPYLRWWRVQALDALVLSHDDLDHTGGAGSLIKALPVRQIWGLWPSVLADWPESGRPPVSACQAGSGWTWDGVRFDFLWPYPDLLLKSKNDRSCVLRIEAQGLVVLITGDLEALGEHILLDLAAPGQLRADLLVLGHHGSKTSSTERFLQVVAPKEVIATVGYLNHYHHPAPQVLKRLSELAIPGWRTDASGAIRYDFLRPGLWPDAQRWRAQTGHYWAFPTKDCLSEACQGWTRLGALTALP